MRRCEDCRHSSCALSMTPNVPDLWVCRARGGMAVLHQVLRALTCRVYEDRYRIRMDLEEVGSDDAE